MYKSAREFTKRAIVSVCAAHIEEFELTLGKRGTYCPLAGGVFFFLKK